MKSMTRFRCERTFQSSHPGRRPEIANPARLKFINRTRTTTSILNNSRESDIGVEPFFDWNGNSLQEEEISKNNRRQTTQETETPH